MDILIKVFIRIGLLLFFFLINRCLYILIYYVTLISAHFDVIRKVLLFYRRS